jgi:integrase
MKPSTEKTIATYGDRGKRVRVVAFTTSSGSRLLRAEWRENGKKTRSESWPDTAEHRKKAKAFAKGVNERLIRRLAPRADVRYTLHELVDKYIRANEHWAPKSRLNVINRLKKFLIFATPNLAVDYISEDMLDDFRAKLKREPTKRGHGHAINQVVHHINEVKRLFRYARRRKWIAENPLADYEVRLAKTEKRDETEEYTNEEWAAILSQLSFRDSRQWRPWCAVALAGINGPRVDALLELQWPDIDLAARTVRWRPETDKVGKDRLQPLPRDAVRALRIARVWRVRDGYQGPYVFYAVKHANRRGEEGGRPYTYSALVGQLHRAGDRAGVRHIPFRAMHGFRRTSAGNVLDATDGNVKAAADWIGDSDLRVVSKYLKKREARQRDVAAKLALPSGFSATVPNERPTVGPEREPAGGYAREE